jgi:hypothetical protein
VRRAHLVMHDFGGSWGFTWAANNLQAVASVTSRPHAMVTVRGVVILKMR